MADEWLFTWFSSDDTDEIDDSVEDSESDGRTSSVAELFECLEQLRVFLLSSAESPLLFSTE